MTVFRAVLLFIRAVLMFLARVKRPLVVKQPIYCYTELGFAK